MKKSRWILLLAGTLAAAVGCASGSKEVVDTSGAAAQEAQAAAARAAEEAAAKAAEEEAAAAAAEAQAEKDIKGDVIAVSVKAGKDLNTFNNQPHTLVLVFYQLSQSSAFSQMLETPEGKAKLMEGESFDPSVLSRRRVVVQPGESQVVVLDRLPGARYLGAVAGYYNAQAPDMSRLVPVVMEKSGMLMWKKPKPQWVRLGLGKNGFTR